MKEDPQKAGASRLVSRVQDERESAFHEIGHAYVAWHATQLERIELVSVSGTSGRCRIIWRESDTEAYRWAHLAVGMGGIAGQAVLHGTFKVKDAQSDLRAVRQEIRELLASFPQTAAPWKEVARRKIDLGKAFVDPPSTRETLILNQCYDIACFLIERRKTLVTRAAHELARKQSLSENELEHLLGDRSPILIAGAMRSGLIIFDP